MFIRNHREAMAMCLLLNLVLNREIEKEALQQVILGLNK